MILKVCGLKYQNNVDQLDELKIDWFGTIFYQKSKRFHDGLKFNTNGKKVGVFVDDSVESIKSAILDHGLDIIQLHGQETADFCATIQTFRLPVIKAFSIDQSFDFAITQPYEQSVDYFLFDTKGELPGGNGMAFDWSILERYAGLTPFILSGGIGIHHVKALKELHHPKLAGIDVNSQFESRPGLKNPQLLKQFIDELHG